MSIDSGQHLKCPSPTRSSGLTAARAPLLASSGKKSVKNRLSKFLDNPLIQYNYTLDSCDLNKKYQIVSITDLQSKAKDPASGNACTLNNLSSFNDALEYQFTCSCSCIYFTQNSQLMT